MKQAAREAKKRLKSGYWSRVRDEHSSITAGNAADVEKYIGNKVLRELKESSQHEQDRLFYKKVEEIIDNECSIINPLRLLTDDTVMETLDYPGRQRYILKISEKYLQTRRQILDERALKNNLNKQPTEV